MEKNAMQRLNDLILQKNSRICVGLELTLEDIPKCITNKSMELAKNKIAAGETKVILYSVEDNVCEYCRQYIETIKDIVPAIKINSAFFEQYGLRELYFKIARKAKDEGLFVIGDINREDVGNNAKAYAAAYLGVDSPFDAVTVGPYIGEKSVIHFLNLAKKNGKGVFVLVKTSNHEDLYEMQNWELKDGRYIYEAVADLVVHFGKEVDKENYGEDGRPRYPMVGTIIGATNSQQAKELHWRTGDLFTLVPEYNVQGTTAEDIAVNFDKNGLGAIINSSAGSMNAYKNERWRDKFSEETWSYALRAEVVYMIKEVNQAINKYYGESIC